MIVKHSRDTLKCRNLLCSSCAISDSYPVLPCARITISMSVIIPQLVIACSYLFHQPTDSRQQKKKLYSKNDCKHVYYKQAENNRTHTIP